MMITETSASSQTADPFLKRFRSIAVMGGTFDPIHYGHLAAAEAVRHAFKPQRVLFVPSGKPPHKHDNTLSSAEHRYQMTLLATAENPFFEASRLETDRPGPSFTIDTARTLLSLYPAAEEIFFITGADAVEEILLWKDARDLLAMCRFVVVARPGCTKESTLAFLEELRTHYGGRLDFLEIPPLAISGTDIRKRIASGKPVKYLLPPPVEVYIQAQRLYLYESTPQARYEEMKNQVRECLSEKRYRHTMGVVEEAERLAAHYGADMDKARTAALLHDCAKEYGAEKKRMLCKLWGVSLDRVLDGQIDLTHSLLSAESARHHFGVNDPETLQAIRFHTTGHRHMTKLDKIIMLADYIEPTREEYPGLTEMRALAYHDMDAALRIGIKDVMVYNKKKGRLIHPWSKDALKALR